MKEPEEVEKTPEEVEKIVNEAISNQSESEKFKNNSKDKPDEKSEEEKIIEQILKNV